MSAQSKDAQNTEFQKNGNAKSAAQKAKDRAKKGFLKFLNIFGEVFFAIASIFPGPGEVPGLGIRLGSTAGKIAAEVGKIAKVGTKIGKGVQKTENFASDVRKVLDLNKGDSQQEIKGLSGKQMADLQQELIGELIKEASKNLGETAKKVHDTARPEAKRYKTGCRVHKKRGVV